MQALGWLANALIVVGLWRLGSKDRNAFLFSIAGELCWTCVAASRGMWDLALICVVFCVMAGRNWWKWGAEGKR